MDSLRVNMPEARNGVVAGSALRRIPKQERSRDRIDEILKVAMDLIGRKGIDAVTMKEIASLSGGPIASVYQYFPNKSAIIATLYDRYITEVRKFMQPGLSGISCAQDITRATDAMIDLYSLFVRNHPPIQDLVNAIQADKMLADIDIAETRKIAEMFCSATEHFIPEASRERYMRTAFMMCHLTVGCVRLALKVPAREGDQIMAEFKASIRVQVSAFLPVEEPVAA
jgi:AcrR family transcriptional regulator